MYRKRMHPKHYRRTALKVFTAIDPALRDDIVVLYKQRRDIEGKLIEWMCIPNPDIDHEKET